MAVPIHGIQLHGLSTRGRRRHCAEEKAIDRIEQAGPVWGRGSKKGEPRLDVLGLTAEIHRHTSQAHPQQRQADLFYRRPKLCRVLIFQNKPEGDSHQQKEEPTTGQSFFPTKLMHSAPMSENGSPVPTSGAGELEGLQWSCPAHLPHPCRRGGTRCPQAGYAVEGGG